ncbi:FKBP-type peptidyl-prolyl cis-trans isomerase [Candidatus Woesearchaeota archaeon]|nr:FKBP-type peptidyl-prolyl cis-trans isomerase [Candidatus Woesearchaeota archaeon]
MDDEQDGKHDSDDEISIDLKKLWPFGKKASSHKSQPGESAERHEEHKGHKEHHDSAQEEHDDEISIDFSGLFRKKESGVTKSHVGKQHGEHHEPGLKKEEEDISIDARAAVAFLREKSGLIIPVLAILFVVGLCVYVRMLPAYMVYADNSATESVYNLIRGDLGNLVDSQYPNLPNENKNGIVDEEFRKAISSDVYVFKTGQYAGQQMSISQQIKITSDYYKSFFEDEKGNLYMPDIDPYYWLRYARNILDHGYPGDVLRDGKSYDTFQLAPDGRFVEPEDTFHPYSIALLFRLLRVFSSEITLMQAEMIYPVIVSAISAVLVFLIARRLAGDVGGFFAAAFMSLNASFLSRSLYGHGDSDTWVVFFSILVTFLFLSAIESRKLRWQLLVSALAGLSVGLYTRFWGGWWFIFDFLIASSAIYGAYLVVTHFRELRANPRGFLLRPDVRALAVVGLAFMLSSGIFVVLISGADYLQPPITALGFAKIKNPVEPTLWPNVLTTVAELNEGSVNMIIDNVGGVFLFFLSLLGIMLAMTKRKVDTTELMFIALAALWWLVLILLRDSFSQLTFIALLSIPVIVRGVYAALRSDPIDMKLSVLLILWYIVTIYASIKGQRFMMLIAPAFGIAIGIAIGFLYRNLNNILSRELKIDRTVTSISLLLISLLILIFPTDVLGVSLSIARQDSPMINDAWFNALTSIRDNSGKTAIITSWWDFGHHFKALAERPVTFDGTTQGSPQAHWVGKLLETDNEDMAVGILRMLDCGGNNAFDEVQKTNKGDTLKSVTVLYSIFEKDRADAGEVLAKKYGMSPEQSESVLNYTHCNPPEAFVIASEDMIGKAGVWAHFGSWNFERAYIWQKLRSKSQDEAVAEMQQKFNYTKDKAEQTYFDIQSFSDSQANSWVSPWPGFMGFPSCQRKGDVAQCDRIYLNGDQRQPLDLEINISSNEVYLMNAPGGPKNLKGVAYLTDTDVAEKTVEENTLSGFDLTATVIPEGDNYRMVVSAPELNASMFTRMFLMEGHSLRHFRLLTHQRSITGADIYVYKVDWNGGEPLIKRELLSRNISSGDEVTFNYIGYLEDGRVFDSSISNWISKKVTKDSKFDQDSSPFTFRVGNRTIIPGLEEKMIGLKKGDEAVIKVPPEKAYGTNPAAHPLGNMTLYFKVRIEKVK